MLTLVGKKVYFEKPKDKNTAECASQKSLARIAYILELLVDNVSACLFVD